MNGNISADPQFVSVSTPDYHLKTGSPAIDAGTSTDAPATDLSFAVNGALAIGIISAPTGFIQ